MKTILKVFIFIYILSFGAKNVLAGTCNPNICSDTYGCTINRCKSSEPLQTNCTMCKPLGKGYDMYCTNCITPTPTPKPTIKPCNSNICSDTYGCLMNPCAGNMTNTNCIICKPLGKGHDEFCKGVCITPTPTPMPTPTPKPKIILIPGYGASWNTQAMMWNAKVKNEEWTMFSLAKKYYSSFDDLMKNNGYTLNKDYFVWNYDWRNPVAQIVSDLKSYYASKFTVNDRVIIVGHSLGGLVGRIFVHDNPTVKVDKLITVGTPHKGALRAYNAWVYGHDENIDSGDFLSRGLKLLLQTRGLIDNQYKTPVDMVKTIQKNVPMMKDILPEFNFIKYKNNFLDYTKWDYRNDYLIAKNREVNWDLKGKMYSIIGVGSSTYETLNLISNVGGTFIYSNEGDGTVLKKSAGVGSSVVEIKNAIHSQLMNAGIDKIAGILGLKYDIKMSTLSVSDDSTPIIFYAHQGVDMTVKCDNGNAISMNEFKMVMFSVSNKICKVNVKADSTGVIRVIIGRLDREGDWIVKSGNSFEINTELLNNKIKGDDLSGPCKCGYVGHCTGVTSYPAQTCSTCNTKCKNSAKCLAKTTIIGMGDFLGNCRGTSFNFIDYCENPDKYSGCDFYKQVDPCMCCNADWGTLGCTKSTWTGSK